MKRIAIIGASRGQMSLCEKAREMGLYTIGFAWEEDAVCKDLFSKFYAVSIMEKDKIIEICKKENVDGVVSTGSEITTEIACYIANKLGFNSNNYENLIKFRNKYKVRQVTNSIPGLTSIKTLLINNVGDIPFYPCIMKPCKSGGKRGVSFVESKEKAIGALDRAQKIKTGVIVEEYIEGQEISVECISYKGQHKIVTIIDRQNLGAPHFVDTRLTMPTTLSEDDKKKIYEIVPKILDVVFFENGPSHIDMKVCGDKIYLIEVNLRGIGGGSPGVLFKYALDFDYTKAIIDVALDEFKFPYKINNIKRLSSFLYYKQNEEEYKEIKHNKKIVAHKLYREEAIFATTLADISGFIVYETE